MKRLMAVLMVVLLMSTVGLAETDYKGLSDEELLELRDSIDDELFERGVEFETEIFFGTYVVGKDIKEGRYNIISTEAGEYGIGVTVYETEQAYLDKDYSMSFDLDYDGSGCYVNLTDGMVMYLGTINGGKMSIRKEKPAWMP